MRQLASACFRACLPCFARLLGVFKQCENPGSWWCQTGWVIWRLAAWEGFIESSLAYIKQFNLSFCVTQVVGSELFEGRRIYSLAKGDPVLLSKPVLSTKLPRYPGYNIFFHLFRASLRGKKAAQRFQQLRNENWKLECCLFPPILLDCLNSLENGKWSFGSITGF